MTTKWIAELPVYLTKSMTDKGFGETLGDAMLTAQDILTRHLINNRIIIEKVVVGVPATLIDAVPNRAYYDDDIVSLAETDPFDESIIVRMVSRFEEIGDHIPARRKDPVEFAVRLRMFTVRK